MNDMGDRTMIGIEVPSDLVASAREKLAVEDGMLLGVWFRARRLVRATLVGIIRATGSSR